MPKSLDAFRTISEVSDALAVPKHVLRFWENKFPQVKPMKRGGGRRYYRPEDIELLRGIHVLLHREGYTIKGVQRILREQGIEDIKRKGRDAAATGEAEGRGRRPPRQPVAPAATLDTERLAALRGAVLELEACRLRLIGEAATLEAARARAGRR